MKIKKAPVTREQKHALLVQAKTHLARDASEALHCRKTPFICWAIDLATYDSITYYARRDVQRLIWERLGGTASLEEWLEEKHGISGHHFPAVKYRNKVQETRHAWIDSLIEEFS